MTPGQAKEAVKLLEEMIQKGRYPSSPLFMSALLTLSRLGEKEIRRLHKSQKALEKQAAVKRGEGVRWKN